MRLAEVFLDASLKMRARVDAPGRYVAPRNVRRDTRIRNRQRKKSVARECVGTGRFASIDVRPSGKTRGVDQERCFCFAKEFEQRIEARIVNLLAGDRPVRPLPPEQFLLKCLPKISRC